MGKGPCGKWQTMAADHIILVKAQVLVARLTGAQATLRLALILQILGVTRSCDAENTGKSPRRRKNGTRFRTIAIT